MQASVYKTVKKRRVEWTPVSPTALEFIPDHAVDLISKALALRSLELPVKSFIEEGLTRQEAGLIGEEGKECLIRNTKDEERHDTALANCVKVIHNYKSGYEKEMDTILNTWKSHPDHPIVKAAMLENGIFFLVLPLMRSYGSPSLRTTSMDISADETNHVQSHRYACIQMNVRPSDSLNKLRKLTVDWLVDKFKDKNTDADKLRKASDNLVYRGVAPELNFTKTYQTPSFFEKRNDVLPYYS